MITTCIDYLLHNRGLSQNTAKAYDEALRDFASFVRDYHPGVRWSTVTKPMIDEYVVYLVSEDYAPATIKLHISALRTFYKTCIAVGGKTDNPARYVSTPKLAVRLPKVIEISAIHQALESPVVSAQAKAAIAIIYETGVRLQELLDITAADIDPSSSSIRVHGKGNKERTVYYGDLTRRYGRCWRGNQHTQRAVRHMVYEALRPYSKAKQLSPHALRHTFATQLLNNGMPMESISRLLGHEHLETTEIYARMSNTTMKNQYLQFLPS